MFEPSCLPNRPKPFDRGFALMTVLCLTTLFCLGIGSILYWSQKNAADDAYRLMLLEGTQAAKMVLEYELAQIQADGLSQKPEGIYDLPADLKTFFQDYSPWIDIDASEVKVTSTSKPKLVYIDPSNPNNLTDPMAGNSVKETITLIMVKMVVQKDDHGPSANIYMAAQVIERELSYFAFASIFDMDMEIINPSVLTDATLNSLIYARGSVWAPGNVWFNTGVIQADNPNSPAAIHGQGAFRHANPIWFDSVSKMNQLASSGKASGQNFFYSLSLKTAINNRAVRTPQGKEQDYYDSLYTPGDDAIDPSITSWDLFASLNDLYLRRFKQALPVPGFDNRHYDLTFQSPTQGSSLFPGNYRLDPPSRSVSNPFWAYLETPLQSNSNWYKGYAVEKLKFLSQACLVARINLYYNYSATSRTTYLKPNMIGANVGYPALPNQTIPILKSNLTKSFGMSGQDVNDMTSFQKQSNLAEPSRISPIFFGMELVLLKQSSNSSLEGLIEFNAVNDPKDTPQTYTFDPQKQSPSFDTRSSGLDAVVSSQHPAFNYAFFLSPQENQTGNHPVEYPSLSFYDPRRKMGIDALFVDVEELYRLLRYDKNLDGYDPQDYNGIFYIWYPERIYNQDIKSSPSSDGLIYPMPDTTYLRKQNQIEVGPGIVLMNGSKVPYSDDPAGGWTIASNIPIYICGDYGSGELPCMVAADSVTVLDGDFFSAQSGNDKKNDTHLVTYYYNNDDDNPRSIPKNKIITLNTSILGGLTMTAILGNGQSIAGDGLLNTPRFFQSWDGDAQGGANNHPVAQLVINGTIFGFFESQVAVGPRKLTPTPPWYFLNAFKTDAPPPGCDHFKYRKFYVPKLSYITEDAYDNPNDPRLWPLFNPSSD